MTRFWRIVQWICLIGIGGAIVISLGAWGVAGLPGGDAVIYPLMLVAYTVGETAHLPSAIVLIVTIVTVWPLGIQYFIARSGSTITGIDPPDMRMILAVLAISALGFTLFRTVDPPVTLDTAESDAHYYIFRARELELGPPEFFLFECDSSGIMCTSVLTPDDVNRSWNMRLRLDAQGETLRILNGQTPIYTRQAD
jgi:hypothetical protein